MRYRLKVEIWDEQESRVWWAATPELSREMGPMERRKSVLLLWRYAWAELKAFLA